MTAAVAALSAPKLREASLDDHAQIAALEARYGLETKNYDEWKHLWVNNPVYRGLKNHWPIGWVLESYDRQIVGCIGNIPLLYEYQGAPLITATAHAWVVDPYYRGYSVLVLDRYFDQKDVDLYLNSTVNPQATAAFRVFNSPPVPVGAWDQSAFWITNYHGFTSSWLTLNAWRRARELSYLFSVALALKDWLAHPRRYANSLKAGVKPVSHFDSRFDDFWEVLRRRRSNELLGVRTSEMLEWHFKYALMQNKAWILTVGRGSSLTAYSIFFRQDNPKFGLTRLRLVDFQSLDGDTALLLPMVLYALKRCQQQRIHMLEYVGWVPQIAAVIERLRPHRRKLPSWLYFYKARDARLAERLADPSAWSPWSFDGDACL